MQKWPRNPMHGALILSVLLTAILLPYWWLAVQWAETLIISPSQVFTFNTTTFLLVLIIIDSTFLVQYYQIRHKNEFYDKTEELKKSEEKYRSLINLAPFPVMITRISDGKILLINKQTRLIFGELSFSPITGKIHNYYAETGEWEKIHSIIKEKKELTGYEVQLITAEGNRFWVSLSAITIDYFGEVAHFLAFININERIVLEYAIRRSEELYRSIISASPDGIITIDPQGVILTVSPAFVIMWNAKIPEDFIGRKINNFIHPDDLDKISLNIQHLLSGSKPDPHEYQGCRLDGSFFPFEANSEVIRDADDKPYAIISIIRDSTARREAERKIRENEERFITIFQEVPDPLLIIKKSGEIIDCNRRFEERIVAPKEEIIEKPVGDLIQIKTDDTSGTRSDIMDILLIGEKVEKEILFPNSRSRYVILSVKEITFRGSQALLPLIQDIDEIKRTQKSITQAYQQLNILNSITRHDILNKVTVINGYSELLLKTIQDSHTKKSISKIYQSGTDIQHLIEFTKEYQDLGMKQPIWQSLDDIIQRRVFLPLIKGVTVSMPDQKIEIYADPMLEKVLYNLIDNSIRHGGSMTSISFSYEKCGDELCIFYTDDGIGISEGEKKKIFNKGFGKNTGLGLFLIRDILKITGISITENGIPGKGVRFRIQVPTGIYRIKE